MTEIQEELIRFKYDNIMTKYVIRIKRKNYIKLIVIINYADRFGSFYQKSEFCMFRKLLI